MKVLVLDVETTGLDDDAHVVELAYLEAEVAEGALTVVGADSFLIDPRTPIPPEASAIHHVTDADVVGCHPESSIPLIVPSFADPVLVGHNAVAFDLPLLRRRANWPPQKWPCMDTLRLVRHLSPNLPSCSLGALYYRYSLQPAAEQFFANMPRLPERKIPRWQHSAAWDVCCCASLLEYILKLTGQDLVALSAQPIAVGTMQFGKHKGVKVGDLPLDYVAWLMRQPWLLAEHPDLHYTLTNLRPDRG